MFSTFLGYFPNRLLANRLSYDLWQAEPTQLFARGPVRCGHD